MPVSTPSPSSAKLPSSSVRPALSLPPLQSLPAKGAKLNPVTMMYEKPIVGTPSSTAASAFLSTSTMNSPVRRGGRAEAPPPRKASEPADAAKAAVAAKGKVIDKLLRAVGGRASGAGRRKATSQSALPVLRVAGQATSSRLFSGHHRVVPVFVWQPRCLRRLGKGHPGGR